MKYVRATILLGIMSFINLMLAIIFNRVRAAMWEALRDASNMTGGNIYSSVNPHLNNFELVFWIIFILSAVGMIIVYIFGSHQEEYEEYRG